MVKTSLIQRERLEDVILLVLKLANGTLNQAM